MKKAKLFLLGMVAVTIFAFSCTPEKIVGDEYQDEVDKDKIERPGCQGGNC